MALADLAVEVGDDSGEPLTVTVDQIAEKFVTYYWRHVVEYVPKGGPGIILRQNTDRQAAIVRHVADVRKVYGESVADARRDKKAWARLIAKIRPLLFDGPLWRLQILGAARCDFLYESLPVGTKVRSVQFYSGVAYSLRRFHPLITEVVRGAWINYVRKQNAGALGAITEISDFLFGSERVDLSIVRPVLWEVQSGLCLYCRSAVRLNAAHVDHFIPWMRYPSNLGHNLVLAHDKCNAAKGALLAADEHLAAWVERNHENQDRLACGFDERRVLHDLAASERIAVWAYHHTVERGGSVWSRANVTAPLCASWMDVFRAARAMRG
jgi:5-methylcytosine-specific restriction endonuclease McrA